jgi:RNA polymerase sigma-70 factor (ECF subfamily)
MEPIVEAADRTQGLIEKARGGNRGAFDDLASGHRSRIEALLSSRLGSTALAASLEDILQETFLRAFVRLEEFRSVDEDSFFRWLSGIAINVARELAKREKRSPLIGLDIDPPASDASPSRVARRRERSERLEEALRGLAPDHREVIRLARLEGLALKAVAQRMGRSPAATRQLLWRALKELKKTFGDTESLHLAPTAPPRMDPDSGGSHAAR